MKASLEDHRSQTVGQDQNLDAQEKCLFEEKEQFRQYKVEKEEEIRVGYLEMGTVKQSLVRGQERLEKLRAERLKKLDMVSLKEAQAEQGTTALEVKTSNLR